MAIYDGNGERLSAAGISRRGLLGTAATTGVDAVSASSSDLAGRGRAVSVREVICLSFLLAAANAVRNLAHPAEGKPSSLSSPFYRNAAPA